MNDHIALAALLRSDLRSFVWKSFQTILPGTRYLPNWHIHAIVHQLMRVQAGDISRLLINQPPRSLKSICVSVAYVAWLLGHDPTRRVPTREGRRRTMHGPSLPSGVRARHAGLYDAGVGALGNPLGLQSSRAGYYIVQQCE